MKLTKKNNGFIAFLLVAITLNTCCMDQVKKEDIGWAALVGGILLGAVAIKKLFFSAPSTPNEPFTFTDLPITFTDLPKDLQKQIIELLSINRTAESLKVAAYTINSLAQVNKELNALINDPKFCLELIKTLAQRFNCSDMKVASALHTQEAQRRIKLQKPLKDYLVMCNYYGNCLVTTNRYGLEWTAINITNLLKNNDVDLEFTSTFTATEEPYAVIYTPLIFCCTTLKRSWFDRAVMLLIEYGANPNTCNNHGDTALMIRINDVNQFGVTGIQALLDAGADPEIANNAGLTPLAAAQQTGNQELIDLIQNAIDKKHGKIKLE